jgi:hypothetical protein
VLHLIFETANQRKGDPLSATPSLRYGATCGARVSRGLAEFAPLRSAQTAASPYPRNAALLGAARGVVRAVAALGRRYPTGLRFARPQRKIQGLRMRTHHTSTRHGALTLVPSGCAEERRRKRDKGRSCLSEASSADPRFLRAPQVARSEAEGHRQWGRLLLLTFLGETRKVSRPPGRDPAYCLNKKARPRHKSNANQALNLFRVKANATQNATPAYTTSTAACRPHPTGH